MNWKTTVILLVVVLGLGTWVVVSERHSATTIRGGNPKLFTPEIDADTVTKIVIDRGKGLSEQIVLTKVEKVGWRLEKPLADRADDGKVREILVKLQFLEHKENGKLEGEKAEKARSQFGDVESRITVSRPTDKGGDATLEIGAKIGNDVRFAKVTSKPNVIYYIPKDVADELAWDLYELRSKEMFTTVGVDAGKLVVTLPPATPGPGAQPKVAELVRGKDRFWRLNGEGGELLDTKKVVDVITAVQHLKPSGIEKDEPAPADLAKYGLDRPTYELRLDAADAPPADPAAPKDAPKPTAKSETLKLGGEVEAGKDVRYALFGDRKIVYKVDASEALKELKKDPLLLRTDLLFALHAGADAVGELSARWSATGRELKLKKKGDDWTLESPGQAKCEPESVKALVRIVAEAKIADRLPAEAAQKLADYGLAQPGLAVTLEEAGEARTLQIGSPIADKPGQFYVRRADEARVFVSKLGDLPEKLSLAPLAVRSKTLLKSSHWDAVQVTLTSPDGKTDFEVKKGGKENHWTLPGVDEKETDEAKISKVVDGFDDVKATDLISEVTSESVVKYGLDKPSKLTVTIDKWDSDAGAKKKTDAVLLLGRRETDRIYAMEQGGSAIGRIDAEFLDRIARGFRKGKELFKVESWDIASVVVTEGDKKVLEIEKKKVGQDDEWFLSDQKLIRSEVRDRLLDAFEKVEATKVETATDETKKTRGLAPIPWRKITIKTRKAFGENTEETKVLLLGLRAGEHEIYAMEEGGAELGVVFDGPATKVDAFAANPPKAPVASPSPTPPAPAPSPAAPPAPSPLPAPGATAPKPAAPQVPGAMPSPPPPLPAPKADSAPVDSPAKTGGK